MNAYYNEIDPYAAQWLRNLIAAGHISPGIVDERSIEDVTPADLAGFTQCHFFAGVGVWSLALRKSGWSDDRPVWTGSCPCQPFSAAGSRAGFEDSRHLWPSFAWLIGQCKPPVIFGEQVASKAVEPWLDLVHSDVEAMGYAFGAVPFPSAGVGAPHIRDRLYWVADSGSSRSLSGAYPRVHSSKESAGARDVELERHSSACRLAQSDSLRLESASVAGIHNAQHHAEPRSSAEWVADNELQQRSSGEAGSDVPRERIKESATPAGLRCDLRPGPVNGLWADADWLGCRDGKWRPVESGTFPLAHGAASRVGRLRAYGNAINAEAATQFIKSFNE